MLVGGCGFVYSRLPPSWQGSGYCRIHIFHRLRRRAKRNEKKKLSRREEENEAPSSLKWLKQIERLAFYAFFFILKNKTEASYSFIATYWFYIVIRFFTFTGPRFTASSSFDNDMLLPPNLRATINQTLPDNHTEAEALLRGREGKHISFSLNTISLIHCT